MADKSMQLILAALSRAVADPAGTSLHGTKAIPGLFAATATGKQAAQRCKDEGYLRVVRTETKGKSTLEICALTEKGLAYLLSQVSPKQVLEDMVRALEARQAQVGELVAAAQQCQAGLDAFKAAAEKVLQQIQRPGAVAGAFLPGPAASTNGSETWTGAILTYLAQRQAAGAAGDCPLPELYRQAHQATPTLTIGHFHDGLRQLREQEQIYLHPWTGPLYDLPEPAYALLSGHEIAYYASIRDQGSEIRDQYSVLGTQYSTLIPNP